MDLNLLYCAAIAGHSDAIAELEKIADGMNTDWTILHYESRDGNTERVRFIVTEFANKFYLVKLDKLKHSALHLAAYHGHTEVVKILLDAARRYLPCHSANDYYYSPVISYFQAFVRQPTVEMNTALHLAVINGHADIARLLVEADPGHRHNRNCSGETPIYLAARLSYGDIVKTICGTCTAPISLDGPLGATALHAALFEILKGKTEDTDVIEVLINAAKRSSYSEDAVYNNFESLFNKTDEQGHTVLSLAVWSSQPDLVKIMLEEDPAYQTGRSSKIRGLPSLIHIAAERRVNDVVELLCKAYEVGITQKGFYALIVAIRRRDKEFAVRLLEQDKLVVTYADDIGMTPLHHAIMNDFDSILDIIIQAQEDVGNNHVSDHTLNPLFLAIEVGYTSTVIRLLELLPVSSYGEEFPDGRILHKPAEQGKKKLIQYILKNCPPEYLDDILNGTDDDGNTPLHLIILAGCFVPELVKHKKVDRMAKNNQDWTPEDMLYYHEHIVADQVLIKEALDDHQTNPLWMFWRRNIKEQSNIEQSIVSPHRRLEKDEKF
ncbi:uncharacterized protein LOC141692843 [Apium graveolens]|uniref:uncharacterized protein LOC141692843 n=1 Tax=Apium graveolens TaxID=4045 RepID=UPI003D7B5742